MEELTCGGMVPQVREAFAETMTAVVQLAAKYPIACSNSIGLLCTIPYTRYWLRHRTVFLCYFNDLYLHIFLRLGNPFEI